MNPHPYPLPPTPPCVYIAGRRCGKTTKVIEWVEQGKRTPVYPFWTRVIVTPTAQEADRLRELLFTRAEARGAPTGLLTEGLLYNQVYAAEEWRRAHIPRDWIGEIAIDNAEWLLQTMFRQPPSLITMTGTVVEDSQTTPKGDKQ